MIVRERADTFVMIEQADHAIISGDLFANWQSELLPHSGLMDAVRYAITNHDYGWHAIDRMPFWNDADDKPYDFMHFPVLPKLIFYRYGIDELENLHPYAGMLASRHYTHLTAGDSELPEVQEFIKLEQARQDRLKQEVTSFDRDQFDFHYALLSICDNISLYLCLNEPGVPKEKEYPLFQKGIPIPAAMKQLEQDRFTIHWEKDHTIQLHPFPFQHHPTVTLKQRVVAKQVIAEKGLLESYLEAPVEEIKLTLIP